MVKGHKNFKNPYSDRREKKRHDIKHSLEHRAKLRRNYFKLLEREGLEENGSKDTDEKKEAPKNKLSFAEKARIVKERKQKQRQERLRMIQEKSKASAKKESERKAKNEKLSQKTKSGQPLMAPKINNLLDQIKRNIGN